MSDSLFSRALDPGNGGPIERTLVHPKGQLFCSVPRACHYLPAKA